MSVQPRSWPTPEVAAAVRAAYRRREPPLPVVVRDRLGEVFPDAEFAPGFGVRGRPGWSPGRLALGLGLDDEGFDASVLSEFRTRVVEHGLEQRVLDLLLAALVEHELVAAYGTPTPHAGCVNCPPSRCRAGCWRGRPTQTVSRSPERA